MPPKLLTLLRLRRRSPPLPPVVACPATFVPASAMPFAKMLLMLGFAVDGVLDSDYLLQKFSELLARWPMLRGSVDTTVTPHVYHTMSPYPPDVLTRHLNVTLAEALGLSFASPPPADRIQHRSLDSVDPDLFHFHPARAAPTFHASYPPPAPGPLGTTANGYEALLTLRVTVLTDATLLGFKMPHHFVDMGDMFKIISAYASLVARKGRSLPVMHLSPDAQPGWLMSTAMIEPHKPWWRKKNEDTKNPTVVAVSGIADAAALDKAPTPPTSSNGDVSPISALPDPVVPHTPPHLGPVSKKLITIPLPFVDGLHRKCCEHLRKAWARGRAPAGYSPSIVLSRNDVIMAWFLKKSWARYPRSLSPATFFYAFSFRPFIAPPESGTTWLHNSTYPLFHSFRSIGEFNALPLSRVAFTIRQLVLQARQPAAVKATLEYWETHPGAKAACPPHLLTGAVVAVTVGTAFAFDTVSWKHALIAPGTGWQGGRREGKAVLTTLEGAGAPGVRSYACIFKDGTRGYALLAQNCEAGWSGHDILDE